MLNFTRIIKREILASLPQKDCCKRAFLRALLTVSGGVFSDRVEFASENERISEYYFSLMEHFGLRPQIDGAVYDARSGKDRINFLLQGEEAELAYRLLFSDDILNYEECCAVAYVRGAFLGSGSCSLPHEGAKSGYHLEFTFPAEEIAHSFCELLDSMLLVIRSIKRGEKHVVYLKSREGVSDFLSVIGAVNAQREFESVTNARAQNNLINRVENCAANNADKSMTASAEQAYRIRKLKESDYYEGLNTQLKELCEERLNNPTLSLRELALKMGVSKSCLNHRMRKLLEICGRTED